MKNHYHIPNQFSFNLLHTNNLKNQILHNNNKNPTYPCSNCEYFSFFFFFFFFFIYKIYIYINITDKY